MITAFKFCARAIFSLLEKTHPPGSQNLCSRNFFHYSTLKYPKKLYIYKKPDTNRCFAKLRAISNLFSFFYTPCIRFKHGRIRVAYAGIRQGREFFLSMLKNFVRIRTYAFTISIL